METDIVSDVLKAVRLSGAIFFEVDACAPWAAASPPTFQLVDRMMPQAQNIAQYHVVTNGNCWASLTQPSDPPIRLETGSVVVFPRGDCHILSSEPHMQAEPVLENYRVPRPDESLPFYLNKNPDRAPSCSLICGFLGCDVKPFNPLIESLPPMLHIADAFSSEDGWLSHLIQGTVEETRKRRVGRDSMLPRLSELMFIEVIRRYLESLPKENSGWISALADQHIGKAITLIHSDPAYPWSLAELSRCVGLSRTIFVQRFSQYLEMAPMTYVLSWRMQLAGGLLKGTNKSVGQIASIVGYESEAAFSRAFKRCNDASPAEWRRMTLNNTKDKPDAGRVTPQG